MKFEEEERGRIKYIFEGHPISKSYTTSVPSQDIALLKMLLYSDLTAHFLLNNLWWILKEFRLGEKKTLK